MKNNIETTEDSGLKNVLEILIDGIKLAYEEENYFQFLLNYSKMLKACQKLNRVECSKKEYIKKCYVIFKVYNLNFLRKCNNVTFQLE